MSLHRTSSPSFPLILVVFGLLPACTDDEGAAVAEPALPGNPGDVVFRLVLQGDGKRQVDVVVPDRPQLECRADCTLYVAPGTQVSLTALPEPNGSVRGWSVPTCGSDANCTVQVDAETTVEVMMGLDFNVAFVTNLAYSVDLLPRPGDAANLECARLAAQAGLHGSRYVAWLSAEGPTLDVGDDVQPARFFQHDGGWVRPDGQPVARSRASLLRGELLHPISLDQLGAVATTRASWTATSSAGLLARTSAGSVLSCGDWVDDDFERNGGIASSETTWVGEGYAASCETALTLMCFGDDSDAEVPVPESVGRLAFTSSATFAPGGGLTGADALCQLEACQAGLTGSASCEVDLGTQRSFQAYLHTSTQRAWERFDLTGPTWVRTDGVMWLSAAAGLGADGVGRLSSLSVHADGSYREPQLSWTGNVGGSANCQDWTSTSAADRGGLGRDAIVDSSGLTDVRVERCAPPGNEFVLICLQE
ncbi:MAG: hypothetical protein RL685_2779 [Pseudomonadota bacterium]